MSKPVTLLLRMIILLLIYSSCNSEKTASGNFIQGVTSENIQDKDLIFFSNGIIDEIYYEENRLTTEVRNKNFKIEHNLSYPHLFRVNLHSEINKIPQRGGYYFLDRSTDSITLSPNGECSLVSGKTQKEFTDHFIPFFLPEYQCKSFEFSNFFYENQKLFDQKLIKYIRMNQESFVALWFLIYRINETGFSPLYEEALKEFSTNKKKHKLWKFAKEQLDKFEIRINHPFPEVLLQDIDFQKQKLRFYSKKYILVDFWFHSCKPCLVQFEKLKKLHESYKNEGFEIVGISVDRSKNKDDWREVIRKKRLPWRNYLDENGKFASKEKIIYFPTSFLLDERGVIVRKNPTIEELEMLLRE